MKTWRGLPRFLLHRLQSRKQHCTTLHNAVSVWPSRWEQIVRQPSAFCSNIFGNLAWKGARGWTIANCTPPVLTSQQGLDPLASFPLQTSRETSTFFSALNRGWKLSNNEFKGTKRTCFIENGLQHVQRSNSLRRSKILGALCAVSTLRANGTCCVQYRVRWNVAQTRTHTRASPVQK